ncbi:MAG: glycosyltransferase family 2 protein [Armatimonadetes bacterium]|nr:glycosyltransferase family 2 protein [Armatimonadota bacterium]
MNSPPLGLSVILPAYNEAEGMQSALAAVVAYLGAREIDGEVIVVDDGSRDATAERAREFAASHPQVRVLSHTPNRGKGYAVKQGMLAARGQPRVFLDVDLATPVEEIDKLLEALEDGAEIAIGTRYVRASAVEVKQRLPRRLMGSAFRWLARLILRLPVSDFTCGAKGFRAEAADELFGRLSEPGWAFDAELLVLAARSGRRVVEVPVRWRDVRGSTVAPLSAAVESLRALWRIRGNDRRGLYEPARDREA